MYICICNSVTESQIQSAVDAGIEEISQLQETLQVSTCCGMCRDDAEACLRRASASRIDLGIEAA